MHRSCLQPHPRAFSLPSSFPCLTVVNGGVCVALPFLLISMAMHSQLWQASGRRPSHLSFSSPPPLLFPFPCVTGERKRQAVAAGWHLAFPYHSSLPCELLFPKHFLLHACDGVKNKISEYEDIHPSSIIIISLYHHLPPTTPTTPSMVSLNRHCLLALAPQWGEQW